MTPDEITQMAEKAANDGDRHVASALYALAAAKLCGLEIVYAQMAQEFADALRLSIDFLDSLDDVGREAYFEWLKKG